MSNIVIYENRSAGVKIPSRKSVQEIFTPLLEAWRNVLHQNDLTVDFDIRYRKEYESLMSNTLRKNCVEQLSNAYYSYQNLEMHIEVCSSYTDSDGKTYRFVFFKPLPECVAKGDFNSAALGLDISTGSDNSCNSVTYSTIAADGKNITLQDMFDELGLTAESKPLIDFINKQKALED